MKVTKDQIQAVAAMLTDDPDILINEWENRQPGYDPTDEPMKPWTDEGSHKTPEEAAKLLTAHTGRRWAMYMGQLCCQQGDRWSPVPYTPGADLDSLVKMVGKHNFPDRYDGRESRKARKNVVNEWLGSGPQLTPLQQKLSAVSGLKDAAQLQELEEELVQFVQYRPALKAQGEDAVIKAFVNYKRTGKMPVRSDLPGEMDQLGGDFRATEYHTR